MPSTFVAKGAEAYEASMGRWSRWLAAPFLDFAGVPSGGRVLDAGCGTGSLTLALTGYPELEAIEALDFEENFVAALRSRTDDARIGAQQGDVCALPFESQTFDAAYSLLVLHFVSDAHKAAREMRRVLRPGAAAAAAVWSYEGMPSWRLFWDTILALEPEAAGNGVPSGRRPLTAEGELRELFETAGFKDIAETTLAITMDYANFEDFWLPKVYGQGTFAAFFDALPEPRRDRLRDALRAAYLAGEREDGPRGFESVAFAVRGTA
ncbi:class I SAM-dependent methyltransferase [Rhizobium beringeri]|jgi:ubiquinone/menaquinone biosynthesis C-methylase UbiE|uniref:Class I SAM-dependent methyltransferase n=1 Tax=Rhizobium beringeri TaxID=3019934 RepID=A0ABY1XV89_9HYPH|nr:MULTISPECIES: class I SAM-dependent methyltransferase [Rhizobium]RWX18427.1 class I SAM-dependent methyltransferase [Rhizobium leguminosarum]TAU53600.1 class I SAM-dependent methyltransferase [Rhizobium leguminosarum]TBC73619.1 class I SAM-dependent methyltransferase [Rhizobium leguminosarum]TBE71490.1 class I SAM-dependent methyltransferase [Rhizobium beringeri]WSG72867.1 class I SAM-dependent methyltransferase [Rhizobium beringeri]